MQPTSHSCLSSQDPSPGLEPLLHDYLHARCDLFTLARRHALSLDQLIQTLRSDAFQQRLRTLEELALARARAVTLAALPAALERLAQLLETPATPPAEARRAATTLLREAARLARPTPTAPTPSRARDGASPAEPEQSRAGTAPASPERTPSPPPAKPPERAPEPSPLPAASPPHGPPCGRRAHHERLPQEGAAPPHQVHRHLPAARGGPPE